MEAVNSISLTQSTQSPSSEARVFVLDLSGGRVFSVRPDGTDQKTLVTGCRHPDGIAVDEEAGHIYWTNMGVPNLEDGSVERSDLDGSNRTFVIREGGTFTPKQIQIERTHGKIYWCDREGMRVMRANLDGSNIEVLVQTGSGAADRKDQKNWCVGIAVDAEGGKVYWTQKGHDDAQEGRLLRANIDIPIGETPSTRSDIETLYAGLPEPIDLELDLATRQIYWTDRGDPPRGNTVNVAPMDTPIAPRLPPTVLINHLMEAIGIALDLEGGRMFVTDLGGSLYTAPLTGGKKQMVMAGQGNLTGVAFARGAPSNH